MRTSQMKRHRGRGLGRSQKQSYQAPPLRSWGMSSSPHTHTFPNQEACQSLVSWVFTEVSLQKQD